MGQPWVYGEVTIVRWGFETTDNQRAPPCFSHLKKGLLKDSFQARLVGGSTLLTNMSQLGWLNSNWLWENNIHVPNHQPDSVFKHLDYPLVNEQFANWKISIFYIGKWTISMAKLRRSQENMFGHISGVTSETWIIYWLVIGFKPPITGRYWNITWYITWSNMI